MLTKLMESSDLVPTIWFEGELNKGAMVPASTSIPGKSYPNPVHSAPTLKLVNSVPPCMSLALLELNCLPCAGAWASEFMSWRVHEWVPQEKHRGLQQLSFSLRCNPYGSLSQKVWGVLFQPWCPQLGSSVWAGTPGSAEGTSAASYLSKFLITTCGCGASPYLISISCLHLSYHSQCDSLCH